MNRIDASVSPLATRIVRACAYGICVSMSCGEVYGKEFVNLEMVDPDVPAGVTYGYGPASRIFPGWDVYRNGRKEDVETFFGESRYTPIQLGVLDLFAIPAWQGRPWTPQIVTGGQAPDQEANEWNDWGSVELRQAGTVPEDAATFEYYVTPRYSAYRGPILWMEHEGVRLGGARSIPVPTGRERDEGFSYDVSALRGKEVTIRVISQAEFGGAFKIVGFSSVPEPGTAALLVLGGAGFWWLAGSGRRRGGPKLCGAPARETRR